MRGDRSDFRALFLNDTPLLDVRAPVEFSKGAFPLAVNLPLLDDAERKKVGICHRQHGPDAALALGHRLVSGGLKEERIAAWANFARTHPTGVMYCFRGGLRSQIGQAWLREHAGIDYPRVQGGYKALRGFLLDTLVHAADECEFFILGGMTGSGKTDILTQLDNGVDLEGHANHRGSSFGRRVHDQPVQIDFENRVAIDLLRKRAQGTSRFIVEDEGGFIGRCSVPLELFRRMRSAPIIWLEDTREARVQRIHRDYVIDLCDGLIALHGPDAGFDLFAQRLHSSLDRIRKRLGSERHRELAHIMDTALAAQRHTGDIDAHRAWINLLLTHYYDPMYVHQRDEKAARVVFSGDRQAVLAFLQERVTAAAEMKK